MYKLYCSIVPSSVLVRFSHVVHFSIEGCVMRGSTVDLPTPSIAASVDLTITDSKPLTVNECQLTFYPSPTP